MFGSPSAISNANLRSPADNFTVWGVRVTKSNGLFVNRRIKLVKHVVTKYRS